MDNTIDAEDFSEEEKRMLELFELYEAGICWECGRQLVLDFRNPDKDNWIKAECPNCFYQTYISREI